MIDIHHFTFSDTICPLLLSPNFGTQMITLAETASYISSRCLLSRDRNLSVKESVVCRKTFTYLRKHSAGEVFFSWTGECFKWKDNRSFCFVLLSNSVIFTCLKFKLSRRDIYPNLKLIQNAKRVRKVF